jgi:hypothetical protein
MAKKHSSVLRKFLLAVNGKSQEDKIIFAAVSLFLMLNKKV